VLVSLWLHSAAYQKLMNIDGSPERPAVAGWRAGFRGATEGGFSSSAPGSGHRQWPNDAR
jgi:hypothetical protein